MTGKNLRLRVIYLFMIIMAALIGVSSRKLSVYPEFLASFAGDTMWASAAYFLIRLIKPSGKILHSALLAMMISILTELSQLYHADWIDQIRKTTIGALVIGSGFVWSDLLCYLSGIVIGIILDVLLLRIMKHPTSY